MEADVGAVQSENGAEHTKLHPAGEQFRLFHAAHMPANVVAPPAIIHIGGGGGEVRLEGERIPGDVGVAGETDWVAMVAEAAPSGEDKRPFRH